MNRYHTNRGWSGRGFTPTMTRPKEPLFMVEKRGPVTGLEPNPKYRHTAEELEQLKRYRPLDFSEPQPPDAWVNGVTEEGLVNYYFRHSDDEGASASMEKIYAWYNAKNWFIRRKYW